MELDQFINETVHVWRWLQEDGGAKRDPPIEIGDYVLDAAGSEIGFFFALVTGCIFILMDQVGGNLFRLKIFLMNRDFHLVENEGFIRFLNWILRLLSIISLFMPFMALAVWAAGLINKAKDFGMVPVGGICVLMVGLAFFFFSYAILKIKWNNFQFTNFTGFCMVLGVLFLTAYQYVAIFLDDHSSFFGFSSIFLCANCIVMILNVFLNFHIENGSVGDLLNNKMGKGEPRDTNRETDFLEEISEERANKSYYPKYEDIIDLFTVGKLSGLDVASAFGGGLQQKFAQLRLCVRRIVTIFLWCCATAILIIYSYVIYWYMDGSSLGFIIMICILITDVFLYLIYNSGIVETATPLAIILFLNRLFLYVFGGDYWVYGMFVLYMIYSVILAVVIAQKRFPFESSFSNLNLDNLQDSNRSVDVSKVPEFVWAVITAIYAAVITILYVVEPAGVPLKTLEMDGWGYPYYINAVFSLLIVSAFFSILAFFRLFIRKKRRILSHTHYYVKHMKFDRYYIFLVVAFLTMATISLIVYWIKWPYLSYFLIICLVSLYVLLYANAYLHYILNDYEILQNIDALNAKILKHNERLGELKVKVAEFKKNIREGNAKGVSEASLGLAKNILQQEKLRKQADKEHKRIQIANEKSMLIATQIQKDQTIGGNIWANMVGAPTGLTLTKNYGSNNQPSSPMKRGSQASNYNSSNVEIRVQQSPQRPTPTLQPSQQQKSSGVASETDKIIEEELKNQDNKKKDEDGIYEGGEDEQDINRVLQNQDRELEEGERSEDDSTDEELDPEDDSVSEKRQRKKMKPIPDWRDNMNFIQAFFTRNLRHNDYQIIFSMIFAHAALALCALGICLDTQSVAGITICIPMVHYGMAIFSLIKVLSTDAKMSAAQYFFFFLSYAIQYGWGIANIYISYTREEMDPSLPGSAQAGTFIVVYLVVIPFITSASSAILKWYDDKGKISVFFVIQFCLTLLQGIGMLVLAYVYMTFIQGVIISVVVAVVVYIVLMIWIYVRNKFYMPKVWVVINLILIFGAIIAAFVVSLIVPGFRVFSGFSISAWAFSALCFVYSFSRIASDVAQQETTPLFFSPWIFPVYKYNAKKNDVDSYNFPVIVMFIGYLSMLAWSVLASVWVAPHHVGVACSVLFELLLIISTLYLMQISATQLKSITKDIDKKIIRRAWLDTKLSYVNSRSAINRDQLITYEKMILRKNFFRNYIRIRDGRDYLTQEEVSEGIVLMEKDEIDVDWIDENKVNLSNQNSCLSYLYEIEQELMRIYREELELIIQFQLLVVQQAENLQEQKKKYLFSFLNEKKSVLFALGIVIEIPDEGNMNVRYARVFTQIQKLSPEKQTMFNHLRDQFIREQREIEEKKREAAKLEEEKQKEREEQLAKMSAAKKKLLASLREDMSVDEMPDCEMKYSKILTEAKGGKIFTDVQFKADNSSLGEKCCNRGVSNWVRARDKPGMVLYKEKISHLDVVQGALGDCYFLSAISVLGEKFVRKVIISSEEEWRMSGSFRIEFYKDGDPETIIIDDFFPAYPNGDWTFVKGGDKGDELWPMVLEKAYAKMYGSYNYIEAGKVQYALSDMTDGFPEQMDLKVEGKNIQVFWEKIKSLKRTGCLMGAGSPENALGDRAINEMGIVQGHAYAVLDVQEVDGTRLMQLRNPHGSAGVEWKGDWSDTCLKWTQRMKNKVSYHDASNDGVFWMDAMDFIQQYSYLYICRILDEDDGWKEVNINGRWTGVPQSGLPSRSNATARLDFNPQYEIIVTKPCDGFISLLQKDKENMFRGKHSIYFMVSKMKGKRITAVDKNTMICRSGNPINLNIVTAECDFDKTVDYPYRFTLMIANLEVGEAAKGEFEFSVFAMDDQIQVNELPYPKDFPKNVGRAPDEEMN